MNNAAGFRNAFCITAICTALHLSAQTVRLLDPATMQFSDEAYGVAFRYPANWTFSATAAPFMLPVPDQTVKGVVFAKTIPGIPTWPITNLRGAELEYSVQKVDSAEACRKLASDRPDRDGDIDQQTLNGVHWNHEFDDAASAGKEDLSDSYTTYRQQYGIGVCLLFVLDVDYQNGGPGDGPRALTHQELETVKGKLQDIFLGVKIDSTKTTP